jgi:AbrB family looped-hinge helix DNA binding protein
MKTKVTTRGQVSIPAKIRKRLDVKPESYIEWVIEGNAVKVIPLPGDIISAFRGKGKGLYKTKELLQDRIRERKTERKKDKDA